MWYYVYNPSKKRVQAHEVVDHREWAIKQIQIVYYKGSHKQYAYGWHEPGVAYYTSRHLSTWLEERDDARAVDILAKARLEKVAEQSQKAMARLGNLQAERDILEAREIEVVE